MPLDLSPFAPAGLTPELLDALVERHEHAAAPRLAALWDYYRNPIRMSDPRTPQREPSARGYRMAQERGLPARLVGGGLGTLPDDRAWKRKEIVIENDIAWRIHTMIDFMFGRPIALASSARDAALGRRIERILDAVWEASGGATLLNDAALMGHVYGHVDLVIRAGTPSGIAPATAAAQGEPDRRDGDDAVIAAARELVRIEAVEPTRAIPVVWPDDYRRLAAYIIRSRRAEPPAPGAAPTAHQPVGALRRWLGLGEGAPGAPAMRSTLVMEVLSAERRRIYELPEGEPRASWRLVFDGPALVDQQPGDAPPVVHIQNIGQPLSWEGLGEVEPLIPLQDELNTRLSDRASRVTFQSFKMLLAKGLEGVDRVSIGPGQVITTDNPEAAIESFGGDAASPSESAHVAEIREAMDKASGVPPLAAGVVRAKIGNLSSANALRVTLMGLLSKTARKRITYGRGIARASQIVLEALDRAGILRTDPRDREVRVVWPDPLPRDENDALLAAERKLALGVPRETVLAELGYGRRDAGVM